MKSCKILWSTQSGRAKACARRTRRVLSERTTLHIESAGCAFDETDKPFIEWVAHNVSDGCFLLLFISTTGDGEHCDSIRNTWKALLQKSLTSTLFAGKKFALFCLGDRAYGDQFCAAGRKLAVRLLQLGMTRYGAVGYGDDSTPNGGVFRDLDDWLELELLRLLQLRSAPLTIPALEVNCVCTFDEEDSREAGEFDALQEFEKEISDYFQTLCPVTAYAYNLEAQRQPPSEAPSCLPPLNGKVLDNSRITSASWEQDTRHIKLEISSLSSSSSFSQDYGCRPYQAGDIAAILPFNSDQAVSKLLRVLPSNIQAHADTPLKIECLPDDKSNTALPWPHRITLRSWLKYCADIQALPEREDLRALGELCSQDSEIGRMQRDKLTSLSETSEAALYADYILREKRTWIDVLRDFESLRDQGSKLSVEALLGLFHPMRPRDFSIASSPTESVSKPSGSTFIIELCVAIVKGQTKRGRKYHGLCSEYLSRQVGQHNDGHSSNIKLWIRPGSFGRLPLDLTPKGRFQIPILCIGAGTGVAPLRSLLRERMATKKSSYPLTEESLDSQDRNQHLLVFGCRKKESDYYYQMEWNKMEEGDFQVLTAFSRDQYRKIYVQQVLQSAESGKLIVNHLIARHGAVYVAGGPRMARAVRDVIIEALGDALGSTKKATVFLAELQRKGLFSVEAWG